MISQQQARRTEVLRGHLLQQIQPHNSNLVPEITSAEQSKELVSYKVDQGVAILTLSSPPVNALSNALRTAIRTNANRAYDDPSVKALVLISAVPKFFIAGADITEFLSAKNSPNKQPEVDVPTFLENGRKPVVAAINGFALGGGLETSMGCSARVATPSSKLGLPELNLGIIPGWGGTARLPRLVGVKKALEMMLTMRPISADEALKLKLVSAVVAPDQLLQTARQLALDIAEHKVPRTNALHLTTRLESPKELEQIFAHVSKQLDDRQPQQRACFNAVKAGIEYGGAYGLEEEKRQSMLVFSQPTAKSLIHLFFAERATGKIPGVKESKELIKSVGVIGGGTMGSGIAIACLEAGCRVILKEVNEKFLDVGMKRIRDTFERKLKNSRISQQQYDKIMSQLTGQINYQGFDQLDMVIEAVLEIIDLKQNIFKDLEQHCSKKCILATNTSTIDINLVGQKTNVQDRIIGLHFFSPANIMPLLEIIITDRTSNEVLSRSVAFAKQIRKTPVCVKNCVGFVLNRIFMHYGGAAKFLVDHGVHPYDIDQAMQEFGFAVGPFRMNDIVGLDTGVLVAKSMANAYPDRVYTGSALAQNLVDAKRLGEKTGAGYYKMEGRKSVQDRETLNKFISNARQAINNPGPLKGQDKFTKEDIQQILLLPIVNEACRVIEEGLVFRVSDIDIASVLGYNFPRFRGGIVKWADTFLGVKGTYQRLKELYDETGLKMFEPANYLKQCYESGKNLEDAYKHSQ